VYDWRAVDPDFEAQIVDAKETLADRLEAEAVHRATVGKNDDLLKFLLKGLRPERYGARPPAIAAVQQTSAVILQPTDQKSQVVSTPVIGPERQAELDWLQRIASGEPVGYPVKHSSDGR